MASAFRTFQKQFLKNTPLLLLFITIVPIFIPHVCTQLTFAYFPPDFLLLLSVKCFWSILVKMCACSPPELPDKLFRPHLFFSVNSSHKKTILYIVLYIIMSYAVHKRLLSHRNILKKDPPDIATIYLQASCNRSEEKRNHMFNFLPSSPFVLLFSTPQKPHRTLRSLIIRNQQPPELKTVFEIPFLKTNNFDTICSRTLY